MYVWAAKEVCSMDKQQGIPLYFLLCLHWSRSENRRKQVHEHTQRNINSRNATAAGLKQLVWPGGGQKPRLWFWTVAMVTKQGLTNGCCAPGGWLGVKSVFDIQSCPDDTGHPRSTTFLPNDDNEKLWATCWIFLLAPDFSPTIS